MWLAGLVICMYLPFLGHFPVNIYLQNVGANRKCFSYVWLHELEKNEWGIKKNLVWQTEMLGRCPQHSVNLQRLMLQLKAMFACLCCVPKLAHWNLLSNNVKYYEKSGITFSAAITLVFSITWSFRNHSNMLICQCQCGKQFIFLS